MRLLAHFCMSVSHQGLACAYNHRVDYKRAREILRHARNRAANERDGLPHVGMTLDEAAAKSGLNRATIHSIENIKREPALKPDLESIERLARAYGLTLTALFARVEGVLYPADAEPRAIVPADPVTERVVQTLADLLTRASERASAAERSPPPPPRRSRARRPTSRKKG